MLCDELHLFQVAVRLQTKTVDFVLEQFCLDNCIVVQSLNDK